MSINTTKYPTTNSCRQGTVRRQGGTSRSRYRGAEGTLSGALSMKPLAYHKQDGSCMYLLRLHVESQTGNPNNNQLNHEATLVAYVPAGKTDYCAALGQGDCVKVRYVIQTDTYLNKEGQPAKKTYFRAKAVYPLNREGKSATGQDEARASLAPQRAGRSASQKPFRQQVSHQNFGVGKGRA